MTSRARQLSVVRRWIKIFRSQSLGNEALYQAALQRMREIIAVHKKRIADELPESKSKPS